MLHYGPLENRILASTRDLADVMSTKAAGSVFGYMHLNGIADVSPSSHDSETCKTETSAITHITTLCNPWMVYHTHRWGR